jgi:hypothetical protein
MEVTKNSPMPITKFYKESQYTAKQGIPQRALSLLIIFTSNHKPQKLLQSDARLFPKMKLNIYFIIKVNIFIFILIKYIIERFIIHLFLICFFIFNRKKLNLEVGGANH